MNGVRHALAVLAAVIGIAAAPATEPATLIRGARVFDGTGRPAVVGNVLVRGERIVALGPNVRAPRGARVIDARGLTLLPGLHDLHTHHGAEVYESAESLKAAYAAYLALGITSVNEYSTTAERMAAIRALTASAEPVAPHLELAVRLGVPGGHGTERPGVASITIQVSTPAEAHAAMARTLPFRPDLIKVFADGWRYCRHFDPDCERETLPSMDVPTLVAIVEDAHRAGLRVVTHTVTVAGARDAAEAGVDALVHGVGDAVLDDATIVLMKRKGTAYVPTLTAFEPVQLRVFLPEEKAVLASPERERELVPRDGPLPPVYGWDWRRWRIMQENLLRVRAAGIPIGVGTDAGVPGAYHASGTLHEMRLLTVLGFTPAEAIIAATSVSAAILGKQADHGRIAPGQHADLVLTGGRPDERFRDLFDVRRVFVSGREVPLERLRAERNGAGARTLPEGDAPD